MARRELLQIAIADVANRLLLSQTQVRALEAGDASAFYNQGFYAQALKRYRTLLGLPEQAEASSLPQPAVSDTPSSSLQVTEDSPTAPAATTWSAPAPQTASGDQAPPADDRSTASTGDIPAPSRKPRVLLPTLSLVLLLVAGIYAITHGGAIETALRDLLAMISPPKPAAVALIEAAPDPADAAETGPGQGPESPASAPAIQPDATPSAPDARGPARPADSAVSPPAPINPTSSIPVVPEPPTRATGFELRASGFCWVFARDADGKETEVTLRPGQSVSLPGNLAYLAIGDVDAVALRFNGSERDISKLSGDSRVARLRLADLDALRRASAVIEDR